MLQKTLTLAKDDGEIQFAMSQAGSLSRVGDV